MAEYVYPIVVGLVVAAIALSLAMLVANATDVPHRP